MKDILIIGTAPNNILDKNIDFLEKKIKKFKYNSYLFLTKEYRNEKIDNYIIFQHNFISKDYKYDFSKYDKIIVCQSSPWKIDYLNVYEFLKNNEVSVVYSISINNTIKKINLKKYSSIFLFLSNKLSWYKKNGF